MDEATQKILEILPTEAPARELTAGKVSHILRRDGAMITGFVTTSPSGVIGIVDKSAVRWLDQEQFWKLMHDD